MPIETLWSRAKTYNKAACTPGRTLQQLWEHTGVGMFTDNVASPETHYYYFCGHFVEDAKGVCSEADKYIRHVWGHHKGVCAMQIVQDEGLHGAGFDNMADGVCPEAMVPLRDAPNRTVLRFLLAEHLAGDQEGIAEGLEEGEEEEDDGNVV